MRRSALALAVTGCLLSAGCGGGAGGGPSVTITVIGGETRGSGEHGGYALEGREIRSSPGPTIRVQADRRVTIVFDNVHGRFHGEYIEHDFAVVADKDHFEPFAPDALWGAKTEVIYPDDPPAAVTFTPHGVGSYDYVCSVPGHVERGMWGRFVVDE